MGSRLERFMAKPKEIDLKGEKLTIKPLTVKDMDLVMDLSKPEKQGVAMANLIRKTLKDAVPDATEEELDSFSLEFLDPLSNAIMEVNNLKVDDAKAKLLENVAKAQGRK